MIATLRPYIRALNTGGYAGGVLAGEHGQDRRECDHKHPLPREAHNCAKQQLVTRMPQNQDRKPTVTIGPTTPIPPAFTDTQQPVPVPVIGEPVLLSDGRGEDSLERIAALWSATTGVQLNAHQVLLMLMQVEVSHLVDHPAARGAWASLEDLAGRGAGSKAANAF